MRFIYTLIFYCSIPFVMLRLLWRAMAAPAYAKRWSERFAFIKPLITNKKVVWFHTVSVGEFIAALPLIRQLQAKDDLQLVITTTTPTGSERVRASLGDSVYHVYAPYDLPDVLARFIRRIKPSLLLIMETELWPNTVAACAKRNIPTLLVNGRMSEKSARGYEKFSGLTAPMLHDLTKGLVQNKTDAVRFHRIGLPTENTEVSGNIKFDLTLSGELRLNAQRLKEEWSEHGKYVVWIAASTHQGEDEIILDAFGRLKKNLTDQYVRLVLVPRHPERFNTVASLCANRGYMVSRRSEKSVAPGTDIILGDTMGELLLMFGASDIAFVGGSLVPNGGHNFIEPAAWALPLLSGPHVFNFAEVAGLLETANALQLVPDSALAAAVEVLVKDAHARSKRGAAALQVANENRGALEKTLKIIEQFL